MLRWIIVTVAALIVSLLCWKRGVYGKDENFDAEDNFGVFCVVVAFLVSVAALVGGVIAGAKIGGILGGIAGFFGVGIILIGTMKTMDHIKEHIEPPITPEKEKELAGYSEAIRLNPGSKEARNKRGYAYLQIGWHKKAIKDFNIAINLDPKNYLYYDNRGYSYEMLKEYDKAIPDYREAIRLKPDDKWAIERLNSVYNTVRSIKGTEVIRAAGILGAIALPIAALFGMAEMGRDAARFTFISGVILAAALAAVTVYTTGRRRAAKRLIDEEAEKIRAAEEAKKKAAEQKAAKDKAAEEAKKKAEEEKAAKEKAAANTGEVEE